MKTYFKIFPYVFLILGVLFLYDAVTRLRSGEDAVVSFLFVGALIFMFFFQRWKYRKFTDSHKNE
ncbi:hypothetical protein [Flavobacterium sp. AG291]|uniref:hypothetical protein n=1 Tax=Flavobacterium sp. AG291 TaxID=2184000 RepID=UPI000E0C3B59|nr:hypothetical protein [Flavobacterium sp. AG291]RDI15861.1 hypothetical protein DEU42_101154 [Flavobacterium sp. AG291]